MLKVDKITKKFGKVIAVENISLEIRKGEIFGLIGANGAGKTTTFRMMLGLIEPTEGLITWEDRKISYKMSNIIGYLPEERGLYLKLKVKDQLRYFAQLRGITKKEADERINYWLERFHISHYLHKKAGDLSKGNQQKIQFVTAILHDPEILVLDEPFTGLDAVNVELMKNVILELKNKGKTILFSSHRLDHVEELCESVCMIKNGKQIMRGKIEDIKSNSKKDKIYVEANYPLRIIDDFKGVKKIEKLNKGYLLHLESENEVYRVLKQIVNRGVVKKFEIKEPTLNEIFIKEVGESYE